MKMRIFNRYRLVVLTSVPLIALKFSSSTCASARQPPQRASVIRSDIPQSNRFTVKDSIEMNLFQKQAGADDNSIAHVSPKNDYFVIVTTHGLLSSNEQESQLWLFTATTINRYLQNSFSKLPSPRPTPRLLAQMASGSDDRPIRQVRWLSNGRGVTFLGCDHRNICHLYLVNAESGAMKRLTPIEQDVTQYDGNGENFVYTFKTPIPLDDLYRSAGSNMSDWEIGTGTSLFDLLYPHWERETFGIEEQRLARIVHGTPVRIRESPNSLGAILVSPKVLSLSPTGRYAIVTTYVDNVPVEWGSYRLGYPSSVDRFTAGKTGTKRDPLLFGPEQYSIVDLETGVTGPLIDAPLGWLKGYFGAPQVKWSTKGDEVAVSDTFLPINGIDREDHGLRQDVYACAVATVDISTRTASCVKPDKFRDARVSGIPLIVSQFEWKGEELLLSYSRGGVSTSETPEIFRRVNGNWLIGDESVSAPARSTETNQNGLSLFVKESINQLPVLMAKREDGVQEALWNPNPQLDHIAWGEASIYHWHDQQGNSWTGGLIKPPDYRPGKRYPLVIQTHGFDPRGFLTDGSYTTAYAAREIAARGIVVLQVQEPPRAMQTPQEAQIRGVAGYISAISALSNDGLIDPNNVGIVGFSKAGWYVLQSLIDSPEHFRAATFAEGTEESFHEYLVDVDYLDPERVHLIVDGVGAAPFGPGLAKWVSSSPGFNTDKIKAPILFQENNPVSLIGNWDLYASFRAQGKTVELIYQRHGPHILTRPQERLVSQEATVDWNDFWLNHHEDSNPMKEKQYVRWREFWAAQAAQRSRDGAGEVPKEQQER